MLATFLYVRFQRHIAAWAKTSKKLEAALL